MVPGVLPLAVKSSMNGCLPLRGTSYDKIYHIISIYLIAVQSFAVARNEDATVDPATVPVDWGKSGIVHDFPE